MEGTITELTSHDCHALLTFPNLFAHSVTLRTQRFVDTAYLCVYVFPIIIKINNAHLFDDFRRQHYLVGFFNARCLL